MSQLGGPVGFVPYSHISPAYAIHNIKPLVHTTIQMDVPSFSRLDVFEIFLTSVLELGTASVIWAGAAVRVECVPQAAAGGLK